MTSLTRLTQLLGQLRRWVVLGCLFPGMVGSEPVKLPGLEINVAKRLIDVKALICLREGTLELVACTKDSKEHESIVAIEAKAMHVHTALLLLGAKPGNPAMRKVEGDDETRWIPVPPRGAPVAVSLVVRNQEGDSVERQINEFIKRADGGESESEKRGKRFPTHAFLFAGSQLQGNGPGPRSYLADRSGNVISLATFGDELLCLPGVHGHESGALQWQVDATHLPAVGSKVVLRLRPLQQEEGGSKPERDTGSGKDQP